MRWPWSRPEPEAAPLAAQPAAAMPVAVVVPVPSAGPAAAPAGAPQGAGGAHVPPIPHSFAQQLQPMSEDELQQLVGADLLMDDLIFGMPEVQALQKRRREAHQELRDLAERVLRQEGEFKGALRACQEAREPLRELRGSVRDLCRQRDELARALAPERVAAALQAEAGQRDQAAELALSEVLAADTRLGDDALAALRKRYVEEKVEKHWRLGLAQACLAG
ncbi:unnamed protein product [Prorocentrum cordatum]|nr:unnamed protein product [Polarella glacialis]|mmetsp:Transcript_95480/g.259167  ORF Transcript_95480/g.259167 Transcript_95480/m.259167 type:complete len:221 (-) Transcript_95480:86-748(-)